MEQRLRRIVAMLAVFAMLFSNCGLPISAEGSNGETYDAQTPLCGLEEHRHTAECYEKALTCGLEETEAGEQKVFRNTFRIHQHTEDCYDEEGRLNCGIEAGKYYHSHNEFCYDEDGNLVCGLEEIWPHEHTEKCYRTEKKLICGKEEKTGHTHTDACYTARKELICGKEEDPGHHHSDACRQNVKVLVCELEENEDHTHTEDCYITLHELTCGEEEREGHTHTDACYRKWNELTCGLQEEEGHTHSESCWETEKILECDKPTTTHHHTAACRDKDGHLTCGETEIPTFVSTADNWTTEGHHHTEACYENVLVCGKTAHAHTEACYTQDGQAAETDGTDGTTEEAGGEAAAAEAPGGEGKGSEETEEEIPEFETEGDILTAYHGEAETVTVPDGIREIGRSAFAGNRTIRILILPDSVEIISNYAFADCISLEQVILGEQNRLAVIGNKAFRNDTKLDLSFAVNVEYIYGDAFEGIPGTEDSAEDGQQEENPGEDGQEENLPAEETEKEPETILIPSGDDAPFAVTVSFSSDAGIPEGTEVTVSEAGDSRGTGEADVLQTRKASRNAATMKAGTRSAATPEEPRAEISSLAVWNAGEAAPDIILYQKALDISLVSGGKEIEPAPGTEITVTVRLPGIEAGQAVEVRHITENGAELLESTNENGDITFKTNSFSMFEFTSRALELATWVTGQTSNTFYGATENQETQAYALSVSDVTEGLEVLEAFTLTNSSDLWMAIRPITDPGTGELESIALYTVENGKLGAIARENITLNDILRFNLGDLSSYALVRDSGLRHRTEEVDNVTLDGMMPKNATAEATDVTESYSGEDFRDAPQTETGEETGEETETPSDIPKVLAAYDISILNDGKEYQPADGKTISVEIRDDRIPAGGEIELWHILDDGTEEKVENFTVEEGRITFEAAGFSVYVIIDHEDEIVVTPRVEFHFIGDEPLDTTGLDYCAAHCYSFRNKSQDGEVQHSQILKDGESLELITDPGNRNENLFYGWYVVNPYVTDETTSYGLIASQHLLYYTWPATPVSVTFESPISIEESNVSIGDPVNWSINGVSGSGTVDSDGNVHVLLAPVFEKYNFINFMLYARDTGITGASNLMKRKLIALGSATEVEVKISDIRSTSVDPVHLIFTGWEYFDNQLNDWVYRQTVDYTGAEMTDPGKDGVYLTVNLADRSSLDLYPKFVQARWVDYVSGISGSGATYVASSFRESWGFDPAQPAQGMVPNERNVFSSLPVPRRDGYQFDGWYAFAITDQKTGDITNLDTGATMTIPYLDTNYEAQEYTGSIQAVKITDGNGNIDENVTTYSVPGGPVLFCREGENLKLFDGLDRLTLYAKWTPINTNITIVYWTEDAADDDYTASGARTISTGDLNEVLGVTSFASGSEITLDILKEYIDKDYHVGIVSNEILDDVGAVPGLSAPDALEAREEIFFELNETLTEDKNKIRKYNEQNVLISEENKIIEGNGSTTFNVYFKRRIFKLVFHIGRDGYVKNMGQEQENNIHYGTWLDYMYKDNAPIWAQLGRTGSARGESYQGYARMMDASGTVLGDSNYVTNPDNIKSDYVPGNNSNDANLYIITAKYGAYIGDQWPSPRSDAFLFDAIPTSSGDKTPYIWTAAYNSLYHKKAGLRDAPGNANGKNPDINGRYEYMSEELCANRDGTGLINANQVHHLVAYFGEAGNENRYKEYHFLYEVTEGVALPNGAQTHAGTEYTAFMPTTWTSANVGSEGIGVIAPNSYYEITDESPVPVISNLAALFQLGTDIEGYQLIYSCYDEQLHPNNDDPPKDESHIFFFYRPKQYQLTFMFESGAVDEMHYYKESLASAKKTAPEKEGYFFKGWYRNEAGQGEPFDFNTTTMPCEGVVLYPVYTVLQFTVQIDPNGGIIDHINYDVPDYYGNTANGEGIAGTGYNQSQSTYFTANYGTTVGEYTIKREYIKLTDKELDPNDGTYYTGTKYYYVNTQFKGAIDGDWGLPPNLRNAVYLTETDLRNYYNFYKNVATANLGYYTGVHILQSFDAFAAAYTSYPNESYRPVNPSSEHYSFMGWYQVLENGSVDSMPYNFNEPVTGDLKLRALWRLDGGYYVQYNPHFVSVDSHGNGTDVTGEISQWKDPSNPSQQLYADQSPTHILHAPTNQTPGWVFRGWRVVKYVGQGTYTDNYNVEHTYDRWDPIQNDENDNAIYYQPGDSFTIDSKLVSEKAQYGSVIHMQAYYEPDGTSARRPEITNLTLDANSGYITNGTNDTELAEDVDQGPLEGNGNVTLKAAEDQIVFSEIQSNTAIHLHNYADDEGTNYFARENYLLLGFDEGPDERDYIATYPADSVITRQRLDQQQNTDIDTLYAVWEQMVYVTFVNATAKPITISLSGTDLSTISIVNQATGRFDRVRASETLTVAAGEQMKIVLPAARPDTDSFTATVVNDHIRTKMSVSGKYEGTDYGSEPCTDIKYGGTLTYTGVLKIDVTGIIVTYTEEIIPEVVYDVNSGVWTEQPAGSGYEHRLGDTYALPQEVIGETPPYADYEPLPPTRSNMIFVGWTEHEEIAAIHDFSTTDPLTVDGNEITVPDGSVQLDVVKSNYLWHFSDPPPYDKTLYAVWSETATVTFDLLRGTNSKHTWTQPNTDNVQGNYKFYRENNSSRVVTYTVMKGDKAVRPSDPTTSASRYFLEWIMSQGYTDTATGRTTISRYIFDFDEPVVSDIRLYTSWTNKDNFQKYTFTVQNIVEDPIQADEEFKYTIYAKDIELHNGSTYVPPAVAFGFVETWLKNNERYTVEIAISRETSNDTHNYTGYDVYVKVRDRSGEVIKEGHLLNYIKDGTTYNEGRQYTYTINVKQTPKAGYSTNVFTDETGEAILTLGDDEFTFLSNNGSHYTPPTNNYAGGTANDKTATVTFVNRQKVDLTLTKTVTTIMGDEDYNFTFTLDSVNGDRAGTKYAYEKTRNGSPSGTGELTTADGSNTFTLQHGESITISLPPDEAIISEHETNYTKAWSTNDATVSLTGTDTATATFTLSGDGAAVIANSRGTQDVTVRKEVEQTQTTDRFTFNATILNGETPTVNYTAYTDTENSSNNLTTNSNGRVTFTLGQDESRTLTIPYGSKLVVAEAMSINYEPSAEMVDGNNTPIEDGDTAAGSFTVDSVTTDGTITFTNTPTSTLSVVFDVKGGDWTTTASPVFEHLMDDLYAITSDNISDNAYEPVDPTKDGMVFVGWTINEEIAEIHDFSSTNPLTVDGDEITVPDGSIQLDVVKNNYLWDFAQDPPYGQTLYAVWSDAVTVTFDIVRTGNNLHTWTGPAVTDVQEPYVYYRSSNTSGAITYTLAKGEQVPKPDNPTTNQAGWYFVNWLLNDTSRRSTTKQPNDSVIVEKTYDFSNRVIQSITLSTSWTTYASQVFTFTVKNNVMNGNPNDTFNYNIAVSNVQFVGKPTGGGNNGIRQPDQDWGSINTTLQNGQQYIVRATVNYIYTSSWNPPDGFNVVVDVFDKDGLMVKTGQLLIGGKQTYKGFSSDYQYTLTFSQQEKAGYETTVTVPPENLFGTVEYPESAISNDPETPDYSFTFNASTSKNSGFTSTFTPEINEYDLDNLTNGLTIVFTNKMPLCKIATVETVEGEETFVEHPFYTLNDAIAFITSASSGTVYATPGSSGYSAGTNPVIEMLVDYTMPSTDKVTIPAGIDVTLTTASKTNVTYPFRGSGTTGTITRGFDDDSMFTVATGASLKLDRITLNGDKSNHTTSNEGGLVNVEANASLTMNTGAALTNSKTTADGGAVYLASGSTFTMNGGTISNCEAANGAAIYADQATLNINGTSQITSNAASGTTGGAINTSSSGATISFSGEPVIYNNPASGSGQKNVVLDLDFNTVINVAGTLGSNAQIGVYDASGSGDTEGGHNRAGEPFGTRATSVTGDFSKFVNDRNGLHGMQSGDDPDMLVIWEAVTLTVSKSVTGGTGGQTQDFTFTLTVAGDGTAPTSYTILKTKQDHSTENGTIASGGTFTLKHNENVLIKWLPKNADITVAETAVDECTTTSSLTTGSGSAAEADGVSRTFTLSDHGTLAVENSLQGQETIVAPTGFSTRHTPWLLLMAFGFILMAFIGSMGYIRRREEEDRNNDPTDPDDPPIFDTGPPGKRGDPGG